MGKTNGFLTATDDVRHTYEQVFYGRQLTGNNVEPESSPLGPWTPPNPSEEPTAGLNGEVLGPEPSAAPPGTPTVLEGQIIEGSGTVHDHAEFYGSVWGHGPGGGAPQIEGPNVEAPAIEPPDQGDDLTPGY